MFSLDSYIEIGTSQVAQVVKNTPANAGDIRDTGTGRENQSLGLEDLLQKGMATHSSVLVWRITLREEPGGL